MTPIESARVGVRAVVDALHLDVTPVELETIATAVVGLVDVLGSAAQRRASAAGVAAAAAVTTADEAELAARSRE